MSLIRLQMGFTALQPALITKARELYAGVVLGECSRSNEQAEINALGKAGRAELITYLQHDPFDSWDRLALALLDNKGSGIRRSVHMLGLAVDLKLFAGQGSRDGITGEFESYRYLQNSAEYSALGEWWEKQHDLARWGGRFGDGGHFSFEYKGIK